MNTPAKNDDHLIEERVADLKAVEGVAREAYRSALIGARKDSVLVPVWQDDRVVWRDPQELLDMEPLPDPLPDSY